MISLPLLKKEIKSNYKILLIFMAILALYIPIIVYMFDPKLGEMLKGFEEAMPEMMAAFGMISSGTSLLSFLSSYLFGFLLLLFPMIFSIMLANKLVVNYVDSGSMACLLASPNTRGRLIITQIFVMLIYIFVLILFATLLAIISSEIMFPNDLDINKYILLSSCLFVLQLAISSIAFFASCIFNEAKSSYLIGAGIPLIFYLIKMLANMGGKLESLKYATIFSLLPVDKIVSGDTQVLPFILTLLIISVILYTLGAIIFTKRDLPL